MLSCMRFITNILSTCLLHHIFPSPAFLAISSLLTMPTFILPCPAFPNQMMPPLVCLMESKYIPCFPVQKDSNKISSICLLTSHTLSLLPRRPLKPAY